ncbi:MAG: alpha-1,3-fucosyltransferase [Acidobacteria bacterium]|nr:alpha-1,3-fucosyltransferase [Acidobacteriota bacterium]
MALMNAAPPPWPSRAALRWILLRNRLRQALRRSAPARLRRRLRELPWPTGSSAGPAGAGAVRGAPLASRPTRSNAAGETVILVYNRMWEQPLEFPSDAAPPGVTFTTDRARFAEAAAVVFHVPGLPPGALRRLSKPPGQVWVAWSFESAQAYPCLDDPRFMRRFDLRMTYRREAEIFMPYLCYYGPDAVEHLRLPPRPKPGGRGPDSPLCLFLASSYRETSGRTLYVRELMRHLPVHSCGRCLNNRPFPGDDGSLRAKHDLQSAYKFTLAFENSRGVDYVTEKFFSALITGSVPVYLGAPNVADFAPGERCYIDAPALGPPRALAEYLRYLDGHEEAYQEYLAWKTRPFRAGFLEMAEAARENPLVRLARRVLQERP